ncbi:Site-specific recombinase XerD [Franzmannia pantelleriensis]|uniref:Site-specific recombinase XerD n=1 Tax=Franzmannia pantelleriensis TaxID=48727 RepID=A0A1G9F054_9GAMM|nr:site-specific integrase [Halomonas pantelleriensis]SDK81816.1 Site-specific recombinase XerD [Halomonas pantelleriensis]
MEQDQLVPLNGLVEPLPQPAPPRHGDGVQIGATSDIQAVTLWLAEYQASPQTQRAYRKEAERLLLWLGERALRLDELRREHLADFEAFLGDPQPAERWIGPPRPRSSAGWRPFRGPLSPASRRQSLVILQGLFAWLADAGWVRHNPFRLMRDKRRRLDNRTGRIERYLERPLWDWLWAWINQPPGEGASERNTLRWQRRRFLFGFAYLLAPRVAELAAARMEDVYRVEGRWWWRVIGKGGKLAEIPLPPAALTLLGEWRQALGLVVEPGPEDVGPLLRGLDGKRGLGDNQLYRLIKSTFAEAADALERAAGRGEVAAPLAAMAPKLRQASPHWLRHTALTHQAQRGVELRYLAMSARHARLDTTARYLHAEAEEWQQQVSRHSLDDSVSASGADTGGDGPV